MIAHFNLFFRLATMSGSISMLLLKRTPTFGFPLPGKEVRESPRRPKAGRQNLQQEQDPEGDANGDPSH